LIAEFWPAGSLKIQEGVGAAFKSILEKKVLQSLEPVLENTKLEPELRTAIQSTLVPLIYPGQSGSNSGVPSQAPVITIDEPSSLSPKKEPVVVELDEEPESNSMEDELLKEEAFTSPTMSSDEDEEDENDEDDQENIAPNPCK